MNTVWQSTGRLHLVNLNSGSRWQSDYILLISAILWCSTALQWGHRLVEGMENYGSEKESHQSSHANICQSIRSKELSVEIFYKKKKNKRQTAALFTKWYKNHSQRIFKIINLMAIQYEQPCVVSSGMLTIKQISVKWWDWQHRQVYSHSTTLKTLWKPQLL